MTLPPCTRDWRDSAWRHRNGDHLEPVDPGEVTGIARLHRQRQGDGGEHDAARLHPAERMDRILFLRHPEPASPATIATLRVPFA